MPDESRDPTPLIIDVTTSFSEPSPPAGPPKGPSMLSKAWSFIRKYLLAPLPVLLLVIGAVVLAMLGAKNVQIGGLIGKLLGKSKPTGGKTLEVANSIPPGRVRDDGSIIKIGEADSKGIVQAQVVAIEKPGIFSDPKTIKVTPPGQTKPIEIAVPDGVKAQDIEQVVVVNTEIKAVTVKSSSPVKAKDVDDLLAKYKL